LKTLVYATRKNISARDRPLLLWNQGVLAAAGGAASREKMNHQRDERKDQEQMNQKARHMVHNEASDPRKEQQ
jgi:hypothetical protein